jgi:hypothetical protein
MAHPVDEVNPYIAANALLRALVGRADAALYQEKRRGRNRVVAQTNDMPPTIAGRVLAVDAPQGLVKSA